jgi:K+/H+ antiporter YhaU regulatory subunit KhtT
MERRESKIAERQRERERVREGRWQREEVASVVKATDEEIRIVGIRIGLRK